MCVPMLLGQGVEMIGSVFKGVGFEVCTKPLIGDAQMLSRQLRVVLRLFILFFPKIMPDWSSY